MKKIIFSLCLLFSMGALYAQSDSDNQNPNWRKSYDKYKQQKDELTAHQGETVQETYDAVQYWYDLQDAKQEWRNERKQLKRERRLERARNPRDFQTIRTGYNYDFPRRRYRFPIRPQMGLYNFDGDWNWMYGFNFGL